MTLSSRLSGRILITTAIVLASWIPVSTPALAQLGDIEWAHRSIGRLTGAQYRPLVTPDGDGGVSLHHGTYVRRFAVVSGRLQQTLGARGSAMSASDGWLFSNDGRYALRRRDSFELLDARTGSFIARRPATSGDLTFRAGSRFFTAGGSIYALPTLRFTVNDAFRSFDTYIDHTGAIQLATGMLYDRRKADSITGVQYTNLPGGQGSTAQGFADSNRLVVGYEGSYIRVWSTDTVRQIHRLDDRRPRKVYPWLVMNQEGRRALTVARSIEADSLIHVWDLVEGTLIGRHDIGALELPLLGAGLTDDERLAVLIDLDGLMYLLDVESGAIVRRMTHLPAAEVTARVSGDGRSIATMDGTGYLRLFDRASGRAGAVIPLPGRERGWYSYPMLQYALSHDGEHVAASVYADTAIHIWSARTGEHLRRIAIGYGTRAIAFHPEGGRLAVAEWGSRAVRLIDVASGATVDSLGEISGGIMSLHFSTDGRWLVGGTYGGNRIGTTFRWDLQRRVPTKTYPFAGEHLIRASDDGRLYFYDPVTKSLDEIAEGAAKRTLLRFDLQPRSIDVTPDGGFAVVSTSPYDFPSGFDLYNLATGDVVDRFRDPMALGASTIYSNEYRTEREVRFTPDGRHVVVASSDGDLLLWKMPGAGMPVAPSLAPSPGTTE